MASFKQYTASGGASESFSIPSFTSDEIKVRVDGVLKSASTHYNITNYTTNGGTVTWTSGNVPSSGTVYIYRDTKILNNGNSDVEGKATYANGAPIYSTDLNNNQVQVLRAIEEENDQLIQSWDLASSSVETSSIKDGTIVNADINASAAIAQSKLNIADATGSASGYMSAANFTKLGGIETGATADQTDAEIRTAVEAASDSNVFTDADHSKLNAIEANATADQTDAEIRAAVEAATDSNVFTDADHTKLNGIASGAEVNVQSNWTQTNNSADDFIKNKPGIVELIDEDDFASDTAAKAPSQQSVKAYIAATSQPKDNELTTLAGMQPGTATQLAGSTALTSTTTELNLLDGKSVVTAVSGSSTDTQLPTAKAVNDQVVSLLNDVGGFVPVANRTSFPNANPDPGNDSGTIVSIADAGGLVVNSSGVATNAATLGGTTVTINGIDSTLHSSTIAAGKGMLVQTTSTLNTYTYHRLVVDEAGVASAQTLVTDFNQRYQVASSTPSNQPDGTALAEGDLWFDTGTDKMKVYSGSQYDVVTSVGDYKLLTIVNDGQTSGSPTYNGSNVSFDLRDGSNAANITSVGQLLISLNGILQKPNAGSWSASNEGFHLEGTNGIKFCTAPVSGDSIFITLIGSATSVNVPATNSIVEAAIQDEQVSEQKLKVSNTGSTGQFLQKSSGTGGLTWAAAGGAGSIANDSIAEVKLDIHADPSGTDKFLAYTSNGMEWAVPTDTNTQLSTEQVQDIVGAMFTGNTETNIAATYEDSDGTIDLVSTDTVYTHPNHSGEVTSSADGAQTIASNVVDEDNLKISNSPTNGQFLQAQSGNTGGLTWASVSAAPTVDLVADGAISNNVACNIKSNGKVEAVTEVAAGANYIAAATGSSPSYTTITYDREHNLIVAFFQQSSELRCVVGTPSGEGSSSTITWGSVQTVDSSQSAYKYITGEYIHFNGTNKHVLSFLNGSSGTYALMAIVVDIAANGTASTGGPQTVQTSSSGVNAERGEICNGHETSYPYLLFFIKSNSDQLQWRDGTVNTGNNTTTAAGGGNCLGTGSHRMRDGMYCFDYLDNTRNTIMCRNNASVWYYNTRIAGSWKTSTEFFPNGISSLTMFYDTTAAKIFAFYTESGTLRFKTGETSTASTGGGIVNWSSATDIRTTVNGWYGNHPIVVWDTKNSKYWLMLSEDSPAQKTWLWGFTINSSAAITWDGSLKEIQAGQKSAKHLFYETSLGNVVASQDVDTWTSYSAASTMDSSNFLGWSNAAASDGNTATVKVVGNTVTGLSGLTPGKKYYVQRDGSIGLTPISGNSVEAGVALTSSSILLK